MRIKDIVKWVLRRTNLIGVSDHVLLLVETLRARRDNKEFFRKFPNYRVPPIRLAFDAYNHVNWKEYHQTGSSETKGYAELFKAHMNPTEVKFLEWGCGPARLIRHFPDSMPGPNAAFWGADYNPETIDWCSKEIPGIRFVVNDLNPPLPFECQFTCILARSVFTHLSEQLHFEWIRELLRVLKPEGILIFSTHGETFKNRLTPKEKEFYDSGKLVVREDSKVGKKAYIAIHSPDFIRNRLLEGNTILQYIPRCSFSGPAGYEQDVWVVRK